MWPLSLVAYLVALFATSSALPTVPHPVPRPVAHPHVPHAAHGAMDSTTQDHKPHAPRACTTIYPALRSAASQPPPYLVTVNASAGVELGFTVPEAAVGSCNLMLQLPSGLTGAGQVNVVALDGPAPGALVGTVDFQPGAQATINSFACRSQMCYSFQLVGGSPGTGGSGGSGRRRSEPGRELGSDRSAVAELSFMEEQGAGVIMTFGC